jgi:hypothetical protein
MIHIIYLYIHLYFKTKIWVPRIANAVQTCKLHRKNQIMTRGKEGTQSSMFTVKESEGRVKVRCTNGPVKSYMQTYIRSYMHTYVRLYTHTYIRSYIHTYIRSYTHTYIRSYTHTYIRSYTHTYDRT